MNGRKIRSRTSLYGGIVLLAVGVLATTSVLLEIPFTQSICEGGGSPQPAQGCGYIPQLVLFVWGDYTALVYGLYLIYAGSALLVLRWLVQMRPKLAREASKVT